MKLTGYTDKWSVRPGEDITFHVHTTAKTYSAELVRLIHGDENPRGPGRKEVKVTSDIDGVYPGVRQIIKKGSYGTIETNGLFDRATVITLTFWMWPTLFGPDNQGLISWLDTNDDAGFGVFIDPDGFLECRQSGKTVLISPTPVCEREWYNVKVVIDVAAGTAAMEIAAQRYQPNFANPVRAQGQLLAAPRPEGARQLLIAAGWPVEGGAPYGIYNGKIARPKIITERDGKQVSASWDFSKNSETSTIVDTDGDRHGQLVNRPCRLMTGPDWPDGSTTTQAMPATHDAIHFHDDDVASAGWPESFRLTVPADLATGVYAARLLADGKEDYLPFFVCPPKSGKRPRLAVLMPTMSYLAYANESPDMSQTIQLAPLQDMDFNSEGYAYVAKNGLKSTYDHHRDGSPIFHGSRQRPIIDFRPHARCRTFDAPHQFPADLHLIDWLTEKGFEFDVITDDLLHSEGESLIEPYRALITGSHPEYWTARMLDARDEWLDAGGRLMYLGGNGFYWVTGIAEDSPDIIEIRRYVGTRTSTGGIGEESLSVTGERGGLWRDRGRAPHLRMGIGFTGQGFDRGTSYKRTKDSYATKWSWIFNGVKGEEFGAGRALVLGHGAAGFEVDSANRKYGTPPHAVVLASSGPFTDAYQAAIETMNSVTPWTGGSHPLSGVRSDVVLTPGKNGGAVFSAGSICWSSTLSANNYDSDTSRITFNVLTEFLKKQGSID